MQIIARERSSLVKPGRATVVPYGQGTLQTKLWVFCSRDGTIESRCIGSVKNVADLLSEPLPHNSFLFNNETIKLKPVPQRVREAKWFEHFGWPMICFLVGNDGCNSCTCRIVHFKPYISKH